MTKISVTKEWCMKMAEQEEGHSIGAGACLDTWCLECNKPATWIRHTQFAGSHPYCEEHAKAEKDFGEDDSYKFWAKVKHTRTSNPS